MGSGRSAEGYGEAAFCPNSARAARAWTYDGDDEAMRRIAAAAAVAVAWVGMTAVARIAGGQDAPPPLTPPLAEPVVDVPAQPANTANRPPLVPAPPPAPGQVLVVPGITTPRLAPKPSQTPVTEPPFDLPPLTDSPSSPPAPTRRDAARPAFPEPMPLGPTTTGRPPLRLESSTIDTDNDPSALTPPISVTPPREDSAPRAAAPPSQAPRRRPFGLFGRILPPIGPLERRDGMETGVRVAPRNDPENDASLKRRIERRIHDDFGTRVKSYEVHVVNGEIAIRARASRFWFRRGVQQGLDALPELRGYRAIVEVLD